MNKTHKITLFVIGTVCLLVGVIGAQPEPLVVNTIEPDLRLTDSSAADYQTEAQQDKVFGIFEIGSSDTDKTFCRYKVTGVTGSNCPLAFGGTVCIPCESEKDCQKIGSSITIDIANDQGTELLCRVLLERLSDKCEECPREGTKIREAEQNLPGTDVIDERQPQPNEKFCVFKAEKSIQKPGKDEKKECPIKKGQVFCVPCFERQKCYLEGLEVIFLGVKQDENSPSCIVIAKSLSLSCKECEKKAKILK